MKKTILSLLTMLLVLAACTGGEPPTSTAESAADPPSATAAATSSPARARSPITPEITVTLWSPESLTSPEASPTFRPTAIIATPEQLDRDFTDSAGMQERREFLVNSRVVSAVEDERVVEALRTVPRHSFIPTASLDAAYEDHPLPIGYGQTISQPSLVAMMTELLDLQEGDRVLEIGTGSGYQAAILRELTDQVYTVEIIPELAATARAVLDRLGYTDIHLDRRDGYYGWPEYAPFDAIIVTAAPDHLPAPLVDQLNPNGGRLVIPIGPVGNVQTLWLVTRTGDDVEMNRMLDVIFVPLTRDPSTP